MSNALERFAELVGDRTDIDPKIAVAALLDLIAAVPDEDVVDSAVSAICTRGPVEPAVIPVFLKLLGDPKRKCWVAEDEGVELLEAFDPAHLTPHAAEILALADDPKVEVRDEVLRRLVPKFHATHAMRVEKIYRAALADKKNPNAGSAALAALVKLGPVGKPFLPEVVGYLKTVPYYYFDAEDEHDLTRIDPDGTDLIPLLVPLLKEKKDQVQVAALRFLTQYGPKAAAAVPEVEKLTKSKNGWLKSAADEALPKLRGTT